MLEAGNPCLRRAGEVVAEQVTRAGSHPSVEVDLFRFALHDLEIVFADVLDHMSWHFSSDYADRARAANDPATSENEMHPSKNWEDDETSDEPNFRCPESCLPDLPAIISCLVIHS